MDSAELQFSKGQLAARIIFKNFGQTPAYDVQSWIGTEVGPHPANRPLKEQSDAIPPKNTIGPGTGTQLVGSGIPLMEFQLPAMFTPQKTLYAYGRLTYRDAFGDLWYANFRMIAGGPEGARISQRTKDGVIKWAMSPDFEGNDAT
jgi:hypothetical protein